MQKIFANIKGDKYLWAAVIMLSLFSFLPGYSASSNLQYIVGTGTTTSLFLKHAAFIFVGIIIVYILQNIDYKYFGAFAFLALPIMIVALAFTLVQGSTVAGENASRWLRIPGTSIGFQTSVFAALTLYIYIARYLTKSRDIEITFSNSIIPLFLPIVLVVGFILPANGSMAVIVFITVISLLFVGGYPIKLLISIVASLIVLVALFIFLTIHYKEQLKGIDRVETWVSRIDKFANSKEGMEDYQVMNAKAAIVAGGITGVGSGKSSFKQVLPQSTSDFIFAIVVEEYGVWGAALLIFIFMFILFRIIVIFTKIHTRFGSLLVWAVGFPIVFQALLNMCVAVNLIPVTGQTLPLISFGGTSMWVTYIALGIIISVSSQIKTKEEIEQEKRKQSESIIEDIA